MNFKTLLIVVILGGAVYSAARIAPPYFANYQFQDDIATVAKFASTTDRTEDDIRTEVLKKATSHDIDLAPETVQVSRQDRNVIIEVHYTVTVNLLPSKSVVIKFDDSSTRGTPGASPAS